jgi:ABC-type Na+ efflux pump permease subunit
MATETQKTMTRATYNKPGALRVTWLIARRQVAESLRDRSTLIMSSFFLIFPLVMVLISVRPFLQGPLTPSTVGFVGSLMAFYLLFAGMMPCTSAVSIAAGVFAGDKERGSLTPLLATSASNATIFAGKVLGAVLPALLFTTFSILAYLAEIALVSGPDKLALLPLGLTSLIIVLIPAIALLGAGLASVISSRVGTFQSAQNYSSLILIVIWFGLFGLLFLVGSLGLWVFGLAVAAIYALATLLVWVSAVTWRREEFMAKQ